MELESDADRLVSLRALGGETATAQAGSFEGMFDDSYQSSFADPAIEGIAQAFTCLQSDVVALNLRKGEPVNIGGKAYRIARIELYSIGMSVLVLKS